MPEHYPKSVTDCWEYCTQCGRNTTHRVDGGRRGPCLDPNHGPVVRAEIPEPEAPPPPQKGLFDDEN